MHTVKWLKWKKLKIPSVDKRVEQLEVSHIANNHFENWHSHFRKLFSQKIHSSAICNIPHLIMLQLESCQGSKDLCHHFPGSDKIEVLFS